MVAVLGVLSAALVGVLGLPVYLSWTNYCFAERRYVPKSEICTTFLASLPKEAFTDETQCVFEPDAMAAFLVFPTHVSRSLYPKTQWGDLHRYYDGCGRRLKFR